MNEFEWRRQLRDLRQPQLPGRDLWASIDAALDNAGATATPATAPIPAVKTRHPRRWLAAAALLLALGAAGNLGWQQLLRTPTPAHLAAGSPASSRTANPGPWKPVDPRFAGAAIELDAAHMELRQALHQSPDSTALQRLLLRTEHQQAQLRQLAREAG